MRRLAAKGAGLSLLTSAINVALQVVSTVILARLLKPHDFGVFTAVTTVSLLLMNCGLNGITEAILQNNQMTDELASNLFWITVGIGALLTLVLASLGPLVAWFFHDPVLSSVTVVTSLTIFVTNTSVVHLALLKRAMRYGVLSAIGICSRGGSMLVSIVTAFAGWHYWALIAGAIAQPLIQSIAGWLHTRWVPGLPKRVAGTAAMLRFSMNVYLSFSVNYFSRNLDNVLVGWRFDSIALGFYKKAYDLFALSANVFSSSLSNIAVTALSRFNHDPVQYRRLVLNSLNVTALIGMALSGDLTLVGPDVIRLVLGPGWETAGHIFQCFAPGIGVMLLYGSNVWISLSLGKANRWFRWTLIEFAVTAGLFLAMLSWGPAAVAIAWTASFWILVIPALWFASKPIDLNASSIIAAVWKYPAAALLALGPSHLLLNLVPTGGAARPVFTALLRLLIGTAAFGTTYCLGVGMLHRGFAPFGLVRKLVRDMSSPRVHSTPATTTAAASMS